MFMLNFILEQIALYCTVLSSIYNVSVAQTFLCISHILHLIHFICDKSMETPCERHYREQKVSDLTSPLLIPP